MAMKRGHKVIKDVKLRFLSYISNITPSGCMEWTEKSLRSPNSYGVFGFNGKTYSSHRVSWMLWKDEDPAHLFVLHKCDNKRCVNPDHLFLGNASDNAKDHSSKGRNFEKNKTHCPYGHSYYGENLYTYISSSGSVKRQCKRCAYLRNKVREEKKKQFIHHKQQSDQ